MGRVRGYPCLDDCIKMGRFMAVLDFSAKMGIRLPYEDIGHKYGVRLVCQEQVDLINAID